MNRYRITGYRRVADGYENGIKVIVEAPNKRAAENVANPPEVLGTAKYLYIMGVKRLQKDEVE